MNFKSTLCFLFSLFLFSGANAQTFNVSNQNVEGWSFVNSSLDFPSFIEGSIQVQNLTNAPIDLRWKRLVKDTPAAWNQSCNFFFQNFNDCLQTQGQVILDGAVLEYMDVSYQITNTSSYITDTATSVYLVYDINDSLNSHYEVTYNLILEFPEPPGTSFTFEETTYTEIFSVNDQGEFPIPFFYPSWVTNNSLFNELNIAWEFLDSTVPPEWEVYCNFEGSDCENAAGQKMVFPESQEFFDFNFEVYNVNGVGGQAVHKFLFYDVNDSLNNNQVITFISEVQLPEPSDQTFTFDPGQDTLYHFYDALPGDFISIFYELLEFQNNSFGPLEMKWEKWEDTKPDAWNMEFDLIMPGNGYYNGDSGIPDNGSFTYDDPFPSFLEYMIHSVEPNGVSGTSVLQLHFYDVNDSIQSNHTITYITTICSGTVASGLIEPLSNTEFCLGDMIDLSAVPGYDNYQWSTGDVGEMITTEVGDYIGITATDEMGCEYMDEISLEIREPYQEAICLVTVDEASGKNQIIWERTPMVNSQSFKIHRQTNQANVYEEIGTLPFDSLSTFIDLGSNPLQSSDRYKISVIDSCGNESPLSGDHKTMHLTINTGINGENNLIWDRYTGFDYATFNILRGSDPNNLQLIAQIASNLFTFTDLAPPSGTLYYQIEVVKPQPCDPVLAPVNEFLSTLSNVAQNQTTGTNNTFEAQNIKMFPNPTNGQVTIQLPWESGNFDLVIEDIAGRLIQSKNQISLSTIEVITTNMVNGIYTVRIIGDQGSFSGKLVIQN